MTSPRAAWPGRCCRTIIGPKTTLADLAKYLEWRPFEGLELQPGNGMIQQQASAFIRVMMPATPLWDPKTLKLWLDGRELAKTCYHWDPALHTFTCQLPQPFKPGFRHLQIFAKDASLHPYTFSWRFQQNEEANLSGKPGPTQPN